MRSEDIKPLREAFMPVPILAMPGMTRTEDRRSESDQSAEATVE